MEKSVIIMTPDEFKNGLKAIGWKQTDFAMSIGVSKVTVSNWLSEANPNPLPQWAINYLLMLHKLHEIRHLLESGLLEPPTKAAKRVKMSSSSDDIGED